jgi:hypothetical protein
MSPRPQTPTARSSTLAATDLDRTLVHSARSGGVAPPGEVICLERRGNVATASLLRSTAATLVGLTQRAIWVPSTTRSAAEYLRLDVEGRLGLAPCHVVCANGGVLLTGGLPDAGWTAQVAVLLAEAAPLGEMSELLARHLAYLPHAGSGPVRDADGVLLSVRARYPVPWLEELEAQCSARRWRVAAHGDKVLLLPMALTKSAAVEEVCRRVGATRLLAAGDSPLDADLLLAAHAGIQPLDGRLYAQGWRAPHVTVTTATGLRAGQEIATWLLAQVPDP